MTFFQGVVIGVVAGYVLSDKIDEILGKATNGDPKPPESPVTPPPTTGTTTP